VGYLEKNIEYFEPPYLYKKDGSGQKATRPLINSAPSSAIYDQNFNITLGQAGTIDKVGLVRLGAATHSQDQGQRYVPLSFTTSGSTLTAKAPANSNIAPAGYYMLFITDGAGVPSVAKIIQLQQKPAVKGASSDFNGDGFSDAAVADQYADPGGVADAGQVTVLYGNSSTIGGGSVDTSCRAQTPWATPPPPETDSGPPSQLLILIMMASPTCWSERRMRTSAAKPILGWHRSSGARRAGLARAGHRPS
jgi:hypothetical protein